MYDSPSPKETKASDPLRRSLALRSLAEKSTPERPAVPRAHGQDEKPWIPRREPVMEASAESAVPAPAPVPSRRRVWTRRLVALAGTAVAATLGWLYFRFYQPYSEVPAYMGDAAVAGDAPSGVDGGTGGPGQGANPNAAAAGASFAPFTLAPKPSPLPLTTKLPVSTVFADDWNYISDDVRIRIEEEYVGPSRCKLAYVTLKDPSLLRTAFAKDKFGRNVKELTSDMAKRKDALFAVNGDYYGYRGDGVIVRGGKLYRDKPVREMLGYFSDGRMEILDERNVDVNALLRRGLMETWSFGPVLVNDGVVTETFGPGIRNENPRTGVGMIRPGTYLFITVDGRQEGSEGMKLVDFAKLFKDKACSIAYNLDGGGSSTMVFRDEVVNSPCGGVAGFSGIGGERSLSDMVYIAPPGEK